MVYADVAGKVAAHMPAGPDRDEILELVRIGLAFRRQHGGRRPGFLHRYVAGVVERLGPDVTFDALVEELQVEAARRGEGARVPVEQVSRSFETITFHDPRKGRKQIAFGTLRNLLTKARAEKFPRSA
jgi:hypothetical protein